MLALLGLALATNRAWGTIQTHLADFVIGQPDFISSGAGTSRSAISHPTGVAMDGSGNLWVADYNNSRVVEFMPPFYNGMNASVVLGQTNFTSGNPPGLSQSAIYGPQGIAVDGLGNLWVADGYSSRVLEFKPPFSNGMNASLILGWSSLTSGGPGTSQSEMNGPMGIAVDGSGNLWVADHDNSRVLEFQPPFSNGMNASFVLGQPNFTSSAPGTSQSAMNSPAGVALDGSGNLWVTDAFNSRVLEFKPPFSNGMNASLVLGQPDFTSGNQGVSRSAMEYPGGAAVDASGYLWVADRDNSRVLEFKPPFSSGMDASLVFGQSNFSSNDAGTSQAAMYGPQGVTVDNSGNLLVADTHNSRILGIFISQVKTVAPASSVNTGALSVTVTGQTFAASSMVALTMSGQPSIPGTNVTIVNSTTITCNFNLLGAVAGNWTVAVTTGPNTSVLTNGFGILGPAVQAVAPVSSANAGALSATITGQNFVAGSTVALTKSGQSSIPGTNVSIVSSTTITCDFDLIGAPACNWNVAVTTGPNTSVLSNGFQILGPHIQTISPGASVNAGSLSATIGGQNFTAGSSVTLTMSGQPSIPGTNVRVISSNTITCNFNLSAAATGYWDVSVATGPNAATITNALVVISAPVSITVGTSSGTIVYPGLAGPSTVQIPAGAYTQPVQITLQTPASLTCSASPAENLTPTNIGLEATLSPNIEPSQPVGLSMSYQNANVTAFTPGSFVIARCDTTTGVWVPLASTVDPLTQAVTAISDHLSVFQIMQATLLTSVSQFKIGPNPLRPSRGQHQMRFLGPPNTEIRIYTLTGQLVKELTTASDGTSSWDATNQSGRDVASGVYFIFVKASGKSETYKAIVER